MLKSSKAAKSDFANRIKTLRAQRSLTSTALAKYAGVSPAAIWQWETNGTVPRRPTLAKLAAALTVSEEFLLTGTAGDMPPPPPAPSPVSHSHLMLGEDAPLEDLVRAIEAKGFVVTLRSKDW